MNLIIFHVVSKTFFHVIHSGVIQANWYCEILKLPFQQF